MRDNSLKQIARFFNKSQNYFYVLKNQNREKFDFIKSFDEDDFRQAVYKYIDYVTAKFLEAQVIYSQLNTEQLDNILAQLGYNNQSPYQSTRRQEFQNRIHRLILEEENLTIHYDTVKKLEQFIKLSKVI
jgi:hypothetical protein